MAIKITEPSEKRRNECSENIIKYKQKHKKRLALRAFVESAGGAKENLF